MTTSAPTSAEYAARVPLRHSHPSLYGLLQFVRKQPLGIVAFGVIVGLSFIALLAPALAPHAQDALPGQPFTSPRGAFPLGTDELGRDVMSRIIWGARISMRVGVLGAFAGVGGGVALAAVTAYAGGVADTIAVRLVDGMQAFPPLLLALVMVSAFGASVTLIMIAVAVIYVPSTARVMRPSVLSLKERQYVEAARSSGAGPVRIVARHIFPNLIPATLIIFSLAVGNAIVIEASLSFLGLGVPPNVASWGGMIQATNIQTLPKEPWTLFSGAAAIALAVYAFNLFGDAVRDALDPRLRTA